MIIIGTTISETTIQIKLLENLIALYFFLCPVEFAFNALVPGGSTLKYLGAIIIIILLLYLYHYKVKLNVYNFHYFIFIWLFVEIISNFWANSSVYASIYTPIYINMTIFFILLTSIQYSAKQIKLFINSTLWGSTLAAIIMLSKMTLYHGMGIRYSLTIFNTEIDPNNIAVFFAFGVIISFYNFFINGNGKILNFVFFVINLVALLISGSRGAIVTIVCTIAIVIMYKFQGKINIFKSIKYIIKIVLILMTIVWILNYLVPGKLLNRTTQVNSYEDGSDRTIIWGYAIERLVEKPILGFGVGTFPELTIPYFDQTKGMHNTYLLVLFDVGIIGFGFFISIIITLAFAATRKKHYFALAILLTALIPSFFIDALVKRFFWNGLILCYMLLSEIGEEKLLFLPTKDK